MFVEPLLVLSGNGQRWIVFGARLDRFAGYIEVHRRLAPAYLLDPVRRHQYLLSRPPVFRIHDDVADRPALVIDKKVFHVSYLAVRCVNGVVGHFAGAPEVTIFRRFSLLYHLHFANLALGRG